jgi:8-oxo-dGTP diphosphatase
VSVSEVVAAGGVLWRPGPGGEPEIVVVHRPRYDDWSLPKGKLERDEHPIEAACREIVEETGFRGVVGPALGTVRYRVEKVGAPTASKLVHYWAVRADGGAFVPGDEVDALRWTAPAKAQLTYPHDEGVVARFTALPPVTGVVLLLRHGLAGERARWAGDDAARPLEPAGVAQARALARVLPWFAPRRILSADRLRCTQTVEPLAEVIGAPIEQDGRLSEEGYRFNPARTVELVRELGGGAVTSALSTQGGVIPGLVSTLAAADGVAIGAPGEVRSGKGSVWCLFFNGRRLVKADYLPPLAG